MRDESQLKTSHLECQINLLRCLKKLILVPDSTVCCVCLCCQSIVCGRWTGSYWSAWLTSSWCLCHHQATHRSAINPSNVLVLLQNTHRQIVGQSTAVHVPNQCSYELSILLNFLCCCIFGKPSTTDRYIIGIREEHHLRRREGSYCACFACSNWFGGVSVKAGEKSWNGHPKSKQVIGHR